MGYTGVVWESRSAEQLARDLTDGPGPSSVGDAGAAWERVATGFAAAADEYTELLDRLRMSWDSAHTPAVLSRLQQLGEWLRAKALNAAANGQRAEEAAVAATTAIMSMPTVSEAVEARAQRDMMASLAAYNGAVLSGQFAEFDAAATSTQADAAAVMHQYEDTTAALATAWDEPSPPSVVHGGHPGADPKADDGSSGPGASTHGGAAGSAPVTPVMPLSPRTPRDIVGSKEVQPSPRVSAVSAASASGYAGAPYAPMAGMGRGYDSGRDYESQRPPEALEGGGEASAGLSATPPSWLPTAQVNDEPILLQTTDTALFDGLVDPVPQLDTPDETPPALEQIAHRWVAPAVIGGESPDS
ncbi:hypothetical protein A5784_28455 [Mycobacterium sp. 852013-50091_SCH5140682]|uniref:PPE domain-containing protein n=1 Tax=Mycobacterium sp. 852013-50091_SCH5140682 TaxID=1834109 RepID=UPI0007E99A72|nr:PPE domain-containing protein [Mycobacterium sp. 852013-50091_SCH5140682]OBC15478.1 hypothetical protein A5784_28455 [Mycobacterium sp. 852013-50091_SCH5140682]